MTNTPDEEQPEPQPAPVSEAAATHRFRGDETDAEIAAILLLLSGGGR